VTAAGFATFETRDITILVVTCSPKTLPIITRDF
jgi:hypothetical protein